MDYSLLTKSHGGWQAHVLVRSHRGLARVLMPRLDAGLVGPGHRGSLGSREQDPCSTASRLVQAEGGETTPKVRLDA